ncbi:MAG: helix-turn-helix transcriptional regulator [Clostridia bacterium]|nr:helix-turn-helix transcriptional regulator [Clostridia bacterium]
MNQSVFSENFRFHLLRYREYHYNDARSGNDCHYIGYMRHGNGFIDGEGRTLQVSEGELFYIPPGFRYESHWRGVPEVHFDSYGFSYFPHAGSATYPLQKIPTTPEIVEKLELLAAHKTVDCFSIGRLYLLLDALLPVMETGNACAKQVAVDESIRYMQECKKLSVPELARHCRMSESGIYAAFREIKGCTPIEMWHRVQSEKAINLLLTTDLSIEEICEKLGFCSASYFRKVLRGATGLTPREIRKNVGV